MKLGVIGLGKMGRQIVQRLINDKHAVVVTSSKPETLELARSWGAEVAQNVPDLVRRLGKDPVVWVMIPSEAVENQIAALIDLMPHSGTIIDGGNSDYRETRRRAGLAAERGVTLIDVGVAGGVLGLTNGFAIMVGGDKATADELTPVFASLAQPSGWGYFGPAGAGHFVKMVHNAVEYGMMEALAEGFLMLKESTDYPRMNLAQISAVWQRGGITASTLNELAGQVLRQNPNLDGVEGYVAATGEAGWALESAEAAGLALPAIKAAVDSRAASRQGHTSFASKLLAALRNSFGGHDLNRPGADE
jgi:6-phosphogluconate dehydrogenase